MRRRDWHRLTALLPREDPSFVAVDHCCVASFLSWSLHVSVVMPWQVNCTFTRYYLVNSAGNLFTEFVYFVF